MPSIVNEVLRSPGNPLDSATQISMESRFGHDFSQVRVHTDTLAADSAEAVNAMAYTFGSHIVFNAGAYDPGSQAGRSLLAHELTHTLQQQSGVEIARQPKAGTSQIAEVVVPKEDPNSYLVFYDPAIKQDRRLLLPVGTKVEVLGKTGEWRDVRLVDGPEPDRKGKLKEKFLHILPVADADEAAKESAPEAKKPESQAKAEGSADPLKRPAKEIMADDKYIDNNIKRMEFYGAQEAHIFYNDGSKLELGLVPEYVKDPFEGVDYHTPRTTHIGVATDEPGALKYIPRGTEVKPPTGTKYGEVLAQLTRSVAFKVEGNSKRIVPTQVNTLTAPILSEMLMKCETEYGKLMDETSKGGVKIFESFKTVLMIYSFLPGGSLAKAAETKAVVGAASGASEGVVATLAKKLAEVLVKGGVEKQILVEGVSFGEVIVARKGTALAVEYTFIENVGRVAGQGRMMQVALENAAIQTAKGVGAAEAQVIVHTVVNEKWLAYLVESLGYTKTIIDKAGRAGFEVVWMKVIPVGG